MNYESTNQILPRGGILRDNPFPTNLDPTTGRGRNQRPERQEWCPGLIPLLLPYLDQQVVYDRLPIGFGMGQGFALNATQIANRDIAIRMKLTSLICPSAEWTNNPYTNPATQAVPFSTKITYAGNYGPDRAFDFLQWRDQPNLRGVFNAAGNWGASPRDITDGLSNTIAFSELVGIDDVLDGRGAWVGGVRTWFAGHNRGVPFGGPSGAGRPRMPNDAFMDWWTELVDNFNPVVPQMPPSFNNNQTVRSSQTARSRHVGGVHAVFCDGGVSFVSDNINPQIWVAALSSRGASRFPLAGSPVRCFFESLSLARCLDAMPCACGSGLPCQWLRATTGSCKELPG
jgi:hypothetical protein